LTHSQGRALPERAEPRRVFGWAERGVTEFSGVGSGIPPAHGNVVTPTSIAMDVTLVSLPPEGGRGGVYETIYIVCRSSTHREAAADCREVYGPSRRADGFERREVYGPSRRLKLPRGFEYCREVYGPSRQCFKPRVFRWRGIRAVSAPRSRRDACYLVAQVTAVAIVANTPVCVSAPTANGSQVSHFI